MNEGVVETLTDTLYELCKLTRRVPMNVFADRLGYARNSVQHHIGLLETLGLVRKASRGFWVPTFDGPYDHDSILTRVILARAARSATRIPGLPERIMALADDFLKDR